MKYNTQNATIKSITEKILIVGIYADIRSLSNLRLQTQEEIKLRRLDQRGQRPCKGVKLTPGLWIDGTKEVRLMKG